MPHCLRCISLAADAAMRLTVTSRVDVTSGKAPFSAEIGLLFQFCLTNLMLQGATGPQPGEMNVMGPASENLHKSDPIAARQRNDAMGPGCVKTHTTAKCGKYNSQTRHRAISAQHDLAFMMGNFFETFYARGGRRSFRTAWARSRQSAARCLITLSAGRIGFFFRSRHV